MASSNSPTSSSKSENSDLSTLTSPSQHHHRHQLQYQYSPDYQPPELISSSFYLTDTVPIMSPSGMTVDGVLHNTEATLLDADITLVDAQTPLPPADIGPGIAENAVPLTEVKNLDEMWQELVNGKDMMTEEIKEEPDSKMTLEDFLMKNSIVKAPVYSFDTGVPEGTVGEVDSVGGGGRAKRGRTVLFEPMDKAAQQRHRRMIKNRESAARSRERKQAYQVELEAEKGRLEEENEQLIKEKEERRKQRYKQPKYYDRNYNKMIEILDGCKRTGCTFLVGGCNVDGVSKLMENVIPFTEQRRPQRRLWRTRSAEW